jgi:PadR family transcriptional regulator
VPGLDIPRLGSRLSTTMTTQRYQNRIELLQGTLDLLILQTLMWGACHGHGIAQAIRANSGEVLQIETGSLYPALHRMERQGWLASEWGLSENNQRAKFYRLTAAGKKQLLAERSKWDSLVKAIAGVLKPA